MPVQRSIPLLLVLALMAGCAPAAPALPSPSHVSTHWVVRTSLVFETLGFLNALVGDPLVVRHFTSDVQYFRERFTPDALDALARLSGARDQEIKRNLSGAFANFFVSTRAATIEDMIAVCDNPKTARQAMLAGGYGEMNWKSFDKYAPDLKRVFEALLSAGFPAYWAERIRPQVEAQVAHLQAYVEGYNVIPLIEQHLGFGLPDDHIFVELAHYMKPFGQRSVGPNFASEPFIPDEHLVRTALHELCHNPVQDQDRAFWNAAASFKTDPLIKQHWEGRDPAYGYNDWGYYVVEDSVRALEQLMAEKAGVARPVRTRWGRDEDGGMHALSIVFYSLMKREGFPQNGERFGDFVVRMVREGKASADRTQALYAAFF